jgi:PAS domain S-box-containing protein
LKSLNTNVDLNSEKKYQDIYNSLDQSFIVDITDGRGDIVYANNQFCKVSKYSNEELIGQNHRILKSGHHTNNFYKKMWNCISSGKIWRGEIKNRAKDGSIFWVDTTIIPFRNENEKPYQYVVIRYDITDKKALQQKIQNSNAALENALIERKLHSQFVSNLAHDLRTPLTTATISAQLIERNINNPDKITHLLKKIIPNLKRVGEMITDFLDTSNIEAEKKVPLEFRNCDMKEILEESHENLATIYGNRFLVNCHGETTGFWNPEGIARIIENLGSNAVKYGSPDAFVDISINGSLDQIELTVHNRGLPLSSTEMDNIFHLNYRTKAAALSGKKGWGIGLNLVRELTESHGGLVTVESGVEIDGTTFKVILPRDSRLTLNT